MRTRDKCMELLKHDDPETSLTRNSLERLIKTGKLPHVNIGSKILVNYDKLLELLAAGGMDDEAPPEYAPGTIRPVKI